MVGFGDGKAVCAVRVGDDVNRKGGQREKRRADVGKKKKDGRDGREMGDGSGRQSKKDPSDL